MPDTTPQGPEMERLLSRLFDDPNRTTLNFKFFPGPRAHLCTTEEIAAELNSAFDQIENGTATWVEDVD